MWFLIVIFVFKSALSAVLFINNQCISLCRHTNLPSLELENYEQAVCQRGCGFFNALKVESDIHSNVTLMQCYMTCEEYRVKVENEICNTGCDLMAKVKIQVYSNDIIYEPGDNIGLASPDRDIDFDLLSDPSIRSQLETGFNVDYKIPETHIRTMPIEITEEEITVKESKDWLDCASYNSGIPRWILLSAILSAVLIALWLSFSNEKRSSQEPTVMIDVDDDKMILISDAIEKDPKFLEANCDIYNSQEVNFSIPPKYAVECEKV